jgi:hypothetical protein
MGCVTELELCKHQINKYKHNRNFRTIKGLEACLLCCFKSFQKEYGEEEACDRVLDCSI